VTREQITKAVAIDGTLRHDASAGELVDKRSLEFVTSVLYVALGTSWNLSACYDVLMLAGDYTP
jgi:hypothetical protein